MPLLKVQLMKSSAVFIRTECRWSACRHSLRLKSVCGPRSATFYGCVRRAASLGFGNRQAADLLLVERQGAQLVEDAIFGDPARKATLPAARHLNARRGPRSRLSQGRPSQPAQHGTGQYTRCRANPDSRHSTCSRGRVIYYLRFFHPLSLACDFDVIRVSNRPVIHCPVTKNRVSILTAAA